VNERDKKLPASTHNMRALLDANAMLEKNRPISQPAVQESSKIIATTILSCLEESLLLQSFASCNPYN
jgi:hypothetical protein